MESGVGPLGGTAKKEKGKKIGMAKVVGFCPALVDPELGMACREEYQLETYTIVDRDGNILADMSAKSITKTFHIPTFGDM